MSEYIEGGNFASYILRHAETQPDALALVIPTGWDGDAGQIEEERVTYLGFAQRTRELMTGFQKLGLQAGDRVIVLFPLSVDLYATVVALWALGSRWFLSIPACRLRRLSKRWRPRMQKPLSPFTSF